MRYEKGRKEASKRRILEVATERFRSDGIAASGLAGIMTSAGLTNGAFYPHFGSKEELVRDSITAALDQQLERLNNVLGSAGLETVVKTYLSVEHRDNAGGGCALAALLPELARLPSDTREVCSDRLRAMAKRLSAELPSSIQNREAVSFAILSTLIGSLQLARAAKGTELSEQILQAGIKAVLSMVTPPERRRASAARPAKRSRPHAKS